MYTQTRENTYAYLVTMQTDKTRFSQQTNPKWTQIPEIEEYQMTQMSPSFGSVARAWQCRAAAAVWKVAGSSDEASVPAAAAAAAGKFPERSEKAPKVKRHFDRPGFKQRLIPPRRAHHESSSGWSEIDDFGQKIAREHDSKPDFDKVKSTLQNQKHQTNIILNYLNYRYTKNGTESWTREFDFQKLHATLEHIFWIVLSNAQIFIALAPSALARMCNYTHLGSYTTDLTVQCFSLK